MEKTAFNQEKFRVRNLERPREGNGELGSAERLISVLAGLWLLKRSCSQAGLHPIKIASSAYLLYRGIGGKCFLYEKALKPGRQSAVNARVTLTVNKPRTEVYDFWRNQSNLPLFMSHIKKVEQQSETVSRWTIELPWGTGELSWDSLIVKDEPHSIIGWHSEKMAILENSGKAEFFDASGGRGTIINLVVSYHPPAGEIGRKIANLFNPAFETLLKQDLRNFKQLIEAGEIATIDGQPSGRNKF